MLSSIDSPHIPWYDDRSHQPLPGVETADLPTHQHHLPVHIRVGKSGVRLIRVGLNVGILTQQQELVGRPVLGKQVLISKCMHG